MARVLFDADGKGDERAARARGKLEALLGLHDLDAALARGWTAAAERVVRRRLAPPAEAPPADAQGPGPPGAVEAVLVDADDLLRALGAEGPATVRLARGPTAWRASRKPAPTHPVWHRFLTGSLAPASEVVRPRLPFETTW